MKEELQEIVDKKKLAKEIFICFNLTMHNRELLGQYREMASSYAPYFVGYGLSWWIGYSDDENFDFVISEKYRFIKDLIAIL